MRMSLKETGVVAALVIDLIALLLVVLLVIAQPLR